MTQNRGRIKVGTLDDTKRVSNHAIHSGVEIKVGTMKKEKIKIAYWKREEDYKDNHTHSSGTPRPRKDESSHRVNDFLSHIVDKGR